MKQVAQSMNPAGWPGLCDGCVHGHRIETARGTTYWRCRLSDVDSRFARYPALPVLRCIGFRRLDCSSSSASDAGGA